ncbi:TonB-dependent receptor [Sphingopyxis sp. SE2]|uniref:TonB-dependent receptor n=1 Tax=Sphingopyxis sp. SE2 TaxID=1586240 RepID=UPI0028C313EC|nr:TonB-dependent receptor [Sphingopyxis sp. SE2]MDT7529110.1 TonB-dependent receptor [Sphingopyxis sp. SE2]
MEFRKLRRRALMALCASAAFTPAAAWAQSDSNGAASPDDGTIIVTAQKREQRLQDVPVSVTALGSAQLEAAGIDSGTEIARQTPNLRVSVLGDESQPKFAIRGISTPEFNLNAISPTGVFYDEVYVGSSFLGGAQIFDIERVEVLRGPQGTLFGKNTTAGAINFISRAPTFRNEGEISVGYGEYGYAEIKGAGEAPLIEDKLSVRFAFNVAHSDGYIENVNPAGRDLSNIDRKAGRLTIGYKDDSGFDATLRLFAVQNDARAIGAINEGLGPGGTNAFGLNPRLNPFDGTPLTRHQVATDRSGVIEVRGRGAILTMNKDLGGVTLTSISSYIGGRFLNLVDGDGTIAPLLHIDFGSKTEEYSQDLRLSTNGSGPFNAIVGLYHQRDDIDIETTYLLFGGPPVFPVLTQSYEQARRSYAVYADGTFDLSDALAVYGGLRYTWDKGRLTNFQVAPIIPIQADKSYRDGEPTGRIGVRLKPADDIMLYGQFARGYRSSAINGGALTNPADLNVANPEKLDSWEVGLKSQLFDRMLTFNASAFLYKFRNQQFINVVGIGTQQLVNAGRSEIKGIEIEAALRPAEGLSFTAGLGLLDSEYKELLLNGVDLSGNELIEAPHRTLNLAADYRVPVGAEGSLSFHFDATNVTRQYFSATNSADFRVPAFWDLGARIAFVEPSGRFEIAAYAKNLTDNRKSTGIQIDPSTLTKFSTVPYPRRFGVELTARFR